MNTNNVITGLSKIVMRRFSVMSLIAATAFVPMFAQTTLTIDSLANRIERQTAEFPQEKIHVTTDRANYFAGDTVWLRAFVVDASNHRPVSVSKYVYVDLKNPYDSVVNRIKIIERNGVYSGYLALPMDMPEGTYMLSAHTLFMDNIGKDYFFRKNIEVSSLQSLGSKIMPQYKWGDDGSLEVSVQLADCSDESAPKKYDKMSYTLSDDTEYKREGSNKPVKFKLKGDRLRNGSVLVKFDNYSKFLRLPTQPSEKFWVDFMPEGGYLVPDVPCRVAFKAIGENGLSTHVTGIINDVEGNKVADFATGHGGMGSVELTPAIGKNYVAVVTDDNGNELKVTLPEVNASAAVLRVDSDDDEVRVCARGNVVPGSLIILQQRGHMLAAAPAFADTPSVFRKSDLGTGVVQVLLLDGACNALSERLVFVRDTSPRRADITVETASGK